VCAVALCVNGLFMFRLDSKTDLYIEFGEYKSEARAANEAIILLWQNEQTVLAYAAAMRSDMKQLLALEQGEATRALLLAMISRELDLIQPHRRSEDEP